MISEHNGRFLCVVEDFMESNGIYKDHSGFVYYAGCDEMWSWTPGTCWMLAQMRVCCNRNTLSAVWYFHILHHLPGVKYENKARHWLYHLRYSDRLEIACWSASLISTFKARNYDCDIFPLYFMSLMWNSCLLNVFCQPVIYCPSCVAVLVLSHV